MITIILKKRFLFSYMEKESVFKENVGCKWSSASTDMFFKGIQKKQYITRHLCCQLPES